MDAYDIEGKSSSNTLFFTLKNDSTTFEQVGIKEYFINGCVGKEGIPCNVVKIKGLQT